MQRQHLGINEHRLLAGARRHRNLAANRNHGDEESIVKLNAIVAAAIGGRQRRNYITIKMANDTFEEESGVAYVTWRLYAAKRHLYGDCSDSSRTISALS